ncbi:hypothetical protein BG004_000954, partial [Podila humilis]
MQVRLRDILSIDRFFNALISLHIDHEVMAQQKRLSTLQAIFLSPTRPIEVHTRALKSHKVNILVLCTA